MTGHLKRLLNGQQNGQQAPDEKKKGRRTRRTPPQEKPSVQAEVLADLVEKRWRTAGIS